MSFSISDWHKRYVAQARWTRDLRVYLYNKVNITQTNKILDVGCGTGVLESELANMTEAAVFGIDIDEVALGLGKQISPEARYIQADAHNLPFVNDIFDISFCHFFLLWAWDPAKVITEMARVTRPGGSILLLAEPDYGGRIDYPLDLAAIGRWQLDSLRQRGADPLIGRKIVGLLKSNGLRLMEFGIMGGRWESNFDRSAWEDEWKVIENDINFLRKTNRVKIPVDDLKQRDLSAWLQGSRVLFVPTFYAWGIVDRKHVEI